MTGKAREKNRSSYGNKLRGPCRHMSNATERQTKKDRHRQTEIDRQTQRNDFYTIQASGKQNTANQRHTTRQTDTDKMQPYKTAATTAQWLLRFLGLGTLHPWVANIYKPR